MANQLTRTRAKRAHRGGSEGERFPGASTPYSSRHRRDYEEDDSEPSVGSEDESGEESEQEAIPR